MFSVFLFHSILISYEPAKCSVALASRLPLANIWTPSTSRFVFSIFSLLFSPDIACLENAARCLFKFMSCYTSSYTRPAAKDSDAKPSADELHTASS